MTAFDLGRIIWEARIREAWGKHADHVMARTPWPKHRAAHDIAAEHELCIAQAQAAIASMAAEQRGATQ